jgi:hypothetical protein
MKPFFLLACALLFSASMGVAAQSCTNTIAVPVNNVLSGTTCGAANQLPAIANGAIQAPGPQVIYDVADFSALYLDETYTLSADPASGLSLFVCRNPCSAHATCYGVADVDNTGAATVHLAKTAAATVIVGSAGATCASYTLTISGTLND